jgi:DNA-binding LytR/AlgR family response regulator
MGQKISTEEGGRQKILKAEPSDLYIWDNGKLVMLEIDKITYLEACRCYCEIHMMDGKTLVPSMPLSKVAGFLPADRFIRVHRTFVVNRKSLKEIYGNTIHLPNGKQLPIGREYRKALLQSLTIINTQNKKYFP